MRIRITYILSCVLLWNFLSAQEQLFEKIDSVYVENEIRRIEINLENGNIESADKSVTSLLFNIAGKGLHLSEARAYFLKGKILQKNIGIEKSFPYLLRSAGILERIKEESLIADVYSEISSGYFSMKAYNKALEYYKKLSVLTLSDDKKMILLKQMGQVCFLLEKYDESESYYKSSIELCNNELFENDIVYLLSKVYRQQNRIEEELDCYRLLFEFEESRGELENMSLLKNNMAYIYQKNSRFFEALEAFQQAYDLSVKAEIPEKETSEILSNIGVCYQSVGQTSNAIRKLREAEKISVKYNDNNEAARLQNIIANLYFIEKDLYNAGVYSQNSIMSAKKAGNRILLADCYRMYSKILKQGNDYINALNNFENHLIIRDSIQRETIISEQELNKKILDLEKEERDLRLKLKDEEVQEMLIAQLRLKLEKEEGEKEILLRDNELALMEKDRIKQQLLLDKQRHETAMRENEKRQLEQQNHIKDLEIEQQEKEKKAKEQEITILETEKKRQDLELEARQFQIEKEKAARQRTVWVSILSGFAAIVILISFINSRRKNKLLAKQKREIELINTDLHQKNEEISTQKEFLQQANMEINSKNIVLEQQHEEISAQKEQLILQKDLIELKNEEITSSINYAQRIQSAIIPSTELMANSFSDHFVLFLPRDIVSGDYYWFGRVEDNVVFTAADCTGHGVPGAFMSMLGVSFLREIVLKEYITHPGLILKRMRKEVVNSLGQAEKTNGNSESKSNLSNVKDGMDMALGSINLKTNELMFSGANNPMYIIRKRNLPSPCASEPMEEGDFVLYEIKGDKMPVAIYERMDNYCTTEIQLLENDLIILFSDGYADQFGGPKGKKFKYKTFKKLLLDNSNLPLVKMKEVLETTLLNWKGDLEQVDDITVVGIRI